jgi:hypothetical protein
MRKFYLLALLVGCSDPDVRPDEKWMSPVDRDLQRVRDSLYEARTMRIRFKGEWPWAVARMPQRAEGVVVLGEGDKAKI